MADYVPKDEAGQIAWLKHFAGWMDAHGLSHSFSAADIAALNAEASAADTAFNNNIEARTAARAALVDKKRAIASAIRLARVDVKLLQANPTTTDGIRAEAGITVPDRIKTPTSPDAVRELDTPNVRLDWSKRLQITVHWGLNPHNEHRNARPACTIGVQIQCHRGGIPEHEDDWVVLGNDSESPYIHTVHEDTPTTYAYRACWIGKRLNEGPYGAPAVCTVSV